MDEGRSLRQDDGRNKTRGRKSEVGDQKTKALMFLPKASSEALLQPNAAGGVLSGAILKPNAADPEGSRTMKYCNQCASELTYRIPEGDDRPRFVCDICRTVHYQNPKLVVGCIPVWKDKILLCRRSIEPRYGKWTIPAGFFEQGETVEDGAKRELYEEACASVEFLEPYALYNLPFISQVYLIFRGPLKDKNFRAGYESLETLLFKEQEIPWDDLAFTVVKDVLHQYYRDLTEGVFPFHMGDIPPGKSP